MTLNDTHDPALKSWLESANIAGADFPIQNLPFAVFRRAATDEPLRGGVAIGDQIVDLARLHARHVLRGTSAEVLKTCTGPDLNAFMALDAGAWSLLRAALSGLLRAGAADSAKLQGTLIAQNLAEYAVPAKIGDFTDFYASIHHATAVGRLFRPDNPLLPNYKWVPIAYHGRSSSIRISGQQIHRPMGQVLPAGADRPELVPSRRLDYELEVGIFIGGGNRLGTRIGVDEAARHVFGLCLLNDWSARDLQAWEYQPLGPFLAKNFATTISPWIITWEALAPYRLAWTRDPADPQPLGYLDSPTLRAGGALDIHLEAYIETAQMRAAAQPPQRLSRSNLRHCYWTVEQMVAHHTVNGCDLHAGDLLGTGTQSGPAAAEAGSLLELTAGGKQPLQLASGETRTFIADGDRIALRGWCEKAQFGRIGFGEVSGTIVPATPLSPAR